VFAKLSRILLSPANWLGLTVAIAVLVLKALGLVGLAGLPLALFGYVAGFVAGGLWLGFPKLAGPAWDADALEFNDDGDAREAMGRALRAVRGLVQFNPENRLPASLQAKVLELCTSLEQLLSQWERSKGACRCRRASTPATSRSRTCRRAQDLPVDPGAVRQLARDPDGKTAVDIFRGTLVDLEGKVAPARRRPGEPGRACLPRPIRSSCTRSSAPRA
jgi:hypothetical protein